jgi:hypothetical protein
MHDGARPDRLIDQSIIRDEIEKEGLRRSRPGDADAMMDRLRRDVSADRTRACGGAGGLRPLKTECERIAVQVQVLRFIDQRVSRPGTGDGRRSSPLLPYIAGS